MGIVYYPFSVLLRAEYTISFVSANANNCLERLVSKLTYVWNGTLSCARSLSYIHMTVEF